MSGALFGGEASLGSAEGNPKIEPTLRRPVWSNGPNHTLILNDNTVGPVTLTSGYGSNTFPYSAAHVLDSSTMLNITPDTRKCEPKEIDCSLKRTFLLVATLILKI